MNPIASPVLAAWSWTSVDLLNHLWQSTAFALAVLALLAVGGRLPAKTRLALGWMALIKFAVPMALLWQLFALGGGAWDRWLGVRTLTLPTVLSPSFFSAADGSATAARDFTRLILTVIWLAGASGLFGRWWIRSRLVRRQILASARPISAAMQRGIKAAATRAGLRQFPRCLAGERDHGPGVLGFFSPVLILPHGLEEKLSRAEFEAVLLHECVHLQRHDNLRGALQNLFGSLLWFHPVVALLNRRIRIETEISCDERVLEITNDPETYAGSIAKSVRYALGIPQAGFVGIATPPVVKRLNAIFAFGTRRSRPAVRYGAFVTGIALFALSGHAGSFAAAPATSTSKPRLVAQNKNSTAPVAAENRSDSGMEVFDISKLDQIPELKFRSDVQYPFAMRRAGIRGEVVVEFIVDTNGKVINAFAVRSSRAEFEANAVNSVAKWRFKPGRKNGRNVNTRMQVPIVFTLNDE